MHEHSPYPVERQQPDYLDTVLEIFNWHKHPFIMVEECALTWMGAAVAMGQVYATGFPWCHFFWAEL